MILIIGATGTNGREILNQLREAGERARAMVRNPAKAEDLRQSGTEVVAGDLDDVASLDAPLKGVDRVFFLTSVDEKFAQRFDNFLKAVLQAGRPRVVKFSGLGSSPESPCELMRIHGRTDEALIASGLPYTILRPNSFYQNMFWSVGSIKAQSAFYLPIGDAKQSLVDVRDIGAVGVETLRSSVHEGKIYEITGPEALTYHDIAAILSQVLGRPISYVPVSSEAAHQGMLASGMPAWNAQVLTDLYQVFAQGEAAQVTNAIEEVTGKPPRSFAEFARDYASAFA